MSLDAYHLTIPNTSFVDRTSGAAGSGRIARRKHRIALRRGPLTLARGARLGGDVCETVDIDCDENGYAALTQSDSADLDKMIEFAVSTKNGGSFKVIDYASAGKTWDERSKYGGWLPTVKHKNLRRLIQN